MQEDIKNMLKVSKKIIMRDRNTENMPIFILNSFTDEYKVFASELLDIIKKEATPFCYDAVFNQRKVNKGDVISFEVIEELMDDWDLACGAFQPLYGVMAIDLNEYRQNVELKTEIIRFLETHRRHCVFILSNIKGTKMLTELQGQLENCYYINNSSDDKKVKESFIDLMGDKDISSNSLSNIGFVY